MKKILFIAGPTASGKSSRAVEEAHARGLPAACGRPAQAGGEIISVDSRQVYRGLDIGTEKITKDEMRGVPHHLIDIRGPQERYSAGDFVNDAERLIGKITAREKLPILVGGTHFYFDALLHGLPRGIDEDLELRKELEKFSTEELFVRVKESDPRRAGELDPKNRRRLVRALEIIASLGSVPTRVNESSLHETHEGAPRGLRGAPSQSWSVEWIVIDPPREELRARIDTRLQKAFERGLIQEVEKIRESLKNHFSSDREQSGFAEADRRLNEFGLEYKIVGEYLRSERTEESLLSALSAKLWQYARRQKAWLRKLGRKNY